MIRIVVFIGLVVLMISVCKKYPEDEALIHFKKPEKRIWKRHLIIKEYEVDGVDSIPHVNAQQVNCCSLDEIEFYFNQIDNKLYSMEVTNSGRLTFEFIEKKNRVKIKHVPTHSGLSYPIFFSEENTWDIKRLDKVWFIIEIDKNNKHYRVRLNK